jgi:hypothetical protein
MWQAQILALVRCRTDVYFHSRNLTDEQVRNAFLIPCHDVDETVAVLVDKYGQGARVCVLPDGPQAIPYLTNTDWSAKAIIVCMRSAGARLILCQFQKSFSASI